VHVPVSAVLLPSELWLSRGFSKLEALALRVAEERARAKESPWSDYLDSLPTGRINAL